MSNSTATLSLREIAGLIRFQQHPRLSACWVWTGPVDATNKQGVISVGGTPMTARQAVYQRYRGKPNGRLFNHCGVRFCVNPSHMEIKR